MNGAADSSKKSFFNLLSGWVLVQWGASRTAGFLLSLLSKSFVSLKLWRLKAALLSSSNRIHINGLIYFQNCLVSP